MERMKFQEAIRKAVETKDAKLAGNMASWLRLDRGLNYREIYEMVNSIAPIDLATWDALLRESEG